MKKRLLLVNPIEGQADTTHNPVLNFPPLHLLTLAAGVPDDWEVVIVDEKVRPADPERLEGDLAGITTSFTCQAPRAYGLSARLRRRGIPVILGGCHASMVPDEAQRHADSVVVGEADVMLADILDDFSRGQLKPRYTPELPDITRLPPPRYDLVRAKDYHVMTIQNSRGCPFKCEFCSVTAFSGATHRMKTEDQVYSDAMLTGARTLMIVDDNLLPGGRRAVEQGLRTFKKLRECGIEWATQISINIVDKPELLAAAAASGARIFYIGLESLSPEILKDMQKPFNVKHAAKGYKDAIQRLHDHGILVIGGLIVGADKDTPDSLKRMVDFVWESQIDATEFQPLTPFPGTPLFDRFFRDGRILYTNYPDDWGRYTHDHVVFRPLHFTPDALFEMTQYLYRQTASLWASILRGARSYWNTRNSNAWRLLVYNYAHKRFADGALRYLEEQRARHRQLTEPLLAGDAS